MSKAQAPVVANAATTADPQLIFRMIRSLRPVFEPDAICLPRVGPNSPNTPGQFIVPVQDGPEAPLSVKGVIGRDGRRLNGHLSDAVR
jgi:hypothetical protein